MRCPVGTHLQHKKCKPQNVERVTFAVKFWKSRCDITQNIATNNQNHACCCCDGQGSRIYVEFEVHHPGKAQVWSLSSFDVSCQWIIWIKSFQFPCFWLPQPPSPTKDFLTPHDTHCWYGPSLCYSWKVMRNQVLIRRKVKNWSNLDKIVAFSPYYNLVPR